MKMLRGNKHYKVLFDLSIAAEPGYAGIAQDSRLMFRTLAQISSVDLTGLITAFRGRAVSRIARRKYPNKRLHNKFGDAAEFLAYLTDGANSWKNALTRMDLFEIALRRMIYFPRAHKLQNFPAKFFDDAVWRTIFAKSLPATDRYVIAEKKFAYSSLTTQAIFDGMFSVGPRPKLDTRGYDFVIFPDARPVRVAANTIKICRYHDAFPITQADTQSGPEWSKIHFRAVDLALKDTYWVCNSPGTREELLTIFRIPDDRVFVIPCAILQPEISDAAFPAQLAGAKGSERSARGDRYILSVGTLEPRKNILRLIEAWETITSTDDPELKLVIVGSPGWRCDDVLRLIKSRSRKGNLLHLQNLTASELRALYRHAQAFIFPSFKEGFGMPPVEALASCTVPIVADTKNNRWVLGEAAVYVDPYDINAIAHGIRLLTTQKNVRQFKTKALENRDKILRRFSLNGVTRQWEELLQTLASRRKETVRG